MVLLVEDIKEFISYQGEPIFIISLVAGAVYMKGW